ncbi:MAG: pyrroloquinoline quinone biosynthesis protein PqqE [Methanoregulaceae archaeon PtaB.Bin108]|nr:MAG: pyrroloquinoline quinone biosynthesis protein PqqE [Methanoregulaceae archaeon PtaB.Bin108]
MTEDFTTQQEIQDFSLWDRMKEKRACYSFTIELTARCNNNCAHCYINLPAGDKEAKERELSVPQIMDIADQAVRLGALWCNITGGEPLIRPDFPEVYLGLKKKGLLVSVMTNATLITGDHIDLFKKYPPRDIEITVYGATRETYETVSRRPGSYDAFMRGLNLLLDAGIKVRLKAMAIHSNLHEIQKIAEFSRAFTKDYYRFDPQLHLRMDHNPARNEEIRRERLTPEEIVRLEQSDGERKNALEKGCDTLIVPDFCKTGCNHLFHCGTGNGDFVVGPDGMFRLCMSLCHPDCVYDLKSGTLEDAWQHFIPKVRDMRTNNQEFLKTCRVCPIINLCLWCPAHADLETGRLDGRVEYFCRVAHARAKALGYTGDQP